jgi:hypothetical protein
LTLLLALKGELPCARTLTLQGEQVDYEELADTGSNLRGKPLDHDAMAQVFILPLVPLIHNLMPLIRRNMSWEEISLRISGKFQVPLCLFGNLPNSVSVAKNVMAASDKNLRILAMQALKYVSDKEAILWRDYDRKKALEAMTPVDRGGEAHDLQGDASVNYHASMSQEPKNDPGMPLQGDAQSPFLSCFCQQGCSVFVFCASL